MALSPITPAADWPSEIADAAIPEFTGRISVIDPSTSNGTYNPDADAYIGAIADTPILSNRAARIQHIRLPLEQSGAREWGAKRRYRFQIELRDGDPEITKGMIVRVIDGGRDPSLVNYAFTVLSATNSSHAAIRTIETISELGAL